ALRPPPDAPLLPYTTLFRSEEKPNGRAVTIMGDREMPYKVLKRVMATCALAEFRDIALAVDKQEAPTLSAASPVANPAMNGQGRSEEHTSELQSRENLVCRL